MTVTLAFYRHRGDWLDRVIRLASGGLYSHVELVLGEVDGNGRRLSISASGRDGGMVRMTEIRFDPDKWDFVELPMFDAKAVRARAMSKMRAKYDYVGAVMSPFGWWPFDNSKRFFCSELVAFALGLPPPHNVTPTALAMLVRQLSNAPRKDPSPI